MPSFRHTIDIAASRDQVWQVLGYVTSVDRWIPGVSSSATVAGCTRTTAAMSVLPTGLLCSGSTGTCRGQRLVEIDQPLLDSVGKDEQAAEIGQRLELDV